MMETIIKRTIKCAYHLGEGESQKQYSVSWRRLKDVHLVFYYQNKWECYVVWNASIMSNIGRKSDTANFIIDNDIVTLMEYQTDDCIKTLDKNVLYKKRFEFFEKVALVPKNKIFDFCHNYEDYIYPTEEDVRQRKYLFALPDSQEIIELEPSNNNYNEVIRERDRISRARRDPDFRDRVLKKYNYTCLVCGCKEPAILEAAHIKGVAEGGDDSTDNGMCLCRNHHKLYDAALLDVDFINKKFSCKSETEKEMAWYKEAMLNDCELVGI